MMATGAILLTLSALLGITFTQDIYGNSISFMPLHKNQNGSIQVTFYQRTNGRSQCESRTSYICEAGVCSSFEGTSVTDQDDTGQECQSEGQKTAVISADQRQLSLSNSGCCWQPNVQAKTDWISRAELDVGFRSDTDFPNNCPLSETVSYLRVPQNCFSDIRLLTYDHEGDHVRCRFAEGATIPTNIVLNETTCVLGAEGEVAGGVHVIELVVEDFPTNTINLTYADGTSREVTKTDALCGLSLQFSLEILPSLPNCESGHVVPVFLFDAPLDREILHASVGQAFKLRAHARAHHASIQDFRFIGPEFMTKEFKDNAHGEAEVTLSWTPQDSDLFRFVPVCFAAETSESQSEMRCVIVVVNQSSMIQGSATVTCSANQMTVAIEKSSLPDLDENYLQLKDPSCSLTSNATHITGSLSFSTCGTTAEDDGVFIAFKNEINSFDPSSDIINRVQPLKIDFSCKIPKYISISSYYNLEKSNFVFTESNFGSFGYSFDIYLDDSFTSPVSPTAFPVEVKLLQTIYFGIKAESELPNAKLFVESCVGTPTDNLTSGISYDLIKGGCLTDETVKVSSDGDMSINMAVQAFKFTGNFDQVYITCSVILCEADNPFSRCAQGCLSEAARRRRRDLGMETYGHHITQGPWRFARQAVPIAAMQKYDAEMEYDYVMENDTATDYEAMLDYDAMLDYGTEQEYDAMLDYGTEQEYDAMLEYDAWMDGDARMGKSGAPVAVSFPPVSSHGGRGGFEIEERFSTNVSIMFFASVFLLSLVVLVVGVAYCTKRRKSDDFKPLLSSDIDG